MATTCITTPAPANPPYEYPPEGNSSGDQRKRQKQRRESLEGNEFCGGESELPTMAIRVIARIRPQQASELDKDVIVTAGPSSDSDLPSSAAPPTLVKIPSSKNENESFTFQFSSVYDQFATQQAIFDNEVAPTIKHLFNGFDVTIFAYGSTGTGKTHTMRGGKTLAERGVIPRLLSGIYRRGRKIDKDSGGQTTVGIALSYYEIYNDKVFDLFEAPEKRTLAGLPLRDSNGKTVIVGLTERPCESLKEFEKLYDQANVHRSTGATKLNAHSSRSHAILCIKLMVTTGDEVRISTASAIDLAGSEDNRRTDNGKERLVESASINKSLFVLAKCVEAIGSKQGERVPYRESKMTRILSLGQNNGLTVMILNLAPVRSFHLETLSSLNFANRTKKIEVQEVENEPVFKGCPRAVPIAMGSSMHRQPLRPLGTTFHNANIRELNTSSNPSKKTSKAFEVYSDKARQSHSAARGARIEAPKRSSPLKRPSESHPSSVPHPSKRRSPARGTSRQQAVMSKETIESIIERKVADILATRALDQPSTVPTAEISEEVQRRLELLEQKIEGQDDSREQGLTFLLMAKQHAVRGEDASALKMYLMAQEYFPHNAKLELKIERLHHRLEERKERDEKQRLEALSDGSAVKRSNSTSAISNSGHVKTTLNEAFHGAPEPTCTIDSFQSHDYYQKYRPGLLTKTTSSIADESVVGGGQTPRTKRLLEIFNTRDVVQIRLLKGVGAKKAEAILEALPIGDERVDSLRQLGCLKGVGPKTVDKMRLGLGEMC